MICFEAQASPRDFFDRGEADLILWPGYWGWEKYETWNKHKKDDELNLIFQNMDVLIYIPHYYLNIKVPLQYNIPYLMGTI